MAVLRQKLQKITMKNKEAIIDNLKRRFDALRANRTMDNFLYNSIEYIDFACGEQELAPLIKKLINNGSLHDKALQQIYNNYLTISYMRDYEDDRHNHIKLPKFYDQDIEERFNLHKNFCQITGNNYEATIKNPNLIGIDCDKKWHFSEYATIQLLHNGLMELLELSVNVAPRMADKKLNFYPDSGEAEYLTAIWQFKGKARAFLTVLQQNKNMNFRVEEIKENCNPLIEIEKHKFRKEKDTSDTLREIRFRLKAKRGEFFPILKQPKGWIWLEK